MSEEEFEEAMKEAIEKGWFICTNPDEPDLNKRNYSLTKKGEFAVDNNFPVVQ